MKRSATPKTFSSKKFKSPLTKTSSHNAAAPTPTSVTIEIDSLKQKLQETDKAITELEELGCKTEELTTHIEKLHQYNEMKDIGQIVLGRIALAQGIQTKDLYKRYGLNFSD